MRTPTIPRMSERVRRCQTSFPIAEQFLCQVGPGPSVVIILQVSIIHVMVHLRGRKNKHYFFRWLILRQFLCQFKTSNPKSALKPTFRLEPWRCADWQGWKDPSPHPPAEAGAGRGGVPAIGCTCSTGYPAITCSRTPILHVVGLHVENYM